MQAIARNFILVRCKQCWFLRIARDTVEEKVLQLQETKRDLAAAITSADNRLIRNLRREDLEMLLS